MEKYLATIMCSNCGILKPRELLAKNDEALQCASCYTGKKKATRKDKMK